jgi:uncharacterized repeat protein (TIGR03837 family)
MPSPSTCDIFCTVIDNYGDIGVSWRLARQLANEHDISVRLWVDDLNALRRIWPTLTDAQRQIDTGVEINIWRQPFANIEPADIVIEAFACELPANYIQAMARRAQRSVWINLDYLSAEQWVTDCHGLPSPQGPFAAPAIHRTLEKYFFFPGFNAGTGGLLRERDLLLRRDAFQRDAAARTAFLKRIGVPDINLDARGALDSSATRMVSLFAYENSSLAGLLEAWCNDAQPLLCLVPEGKSIKGIADFFGSSDMAVGSVYRRGALSLVVLPFLPQDDYDLLLWSCDLNFVRGEDSFVRAQWAAQPLIWHIYPQPEEAHRPKLNAFLELYRAGLTAPDAEALSRFWSAWNGEGDIGAAWRQLTPRLPALARHAQVWSGELAQRENLAGALVQFCANHV